MKVSTFFTGVITLVSVLAFPGGLVQAAEVVMGTGSRAGVYFQVGRATCRLKGKLISSLLKQFNGNRDCTGCIGNAKHSER